LNLVVALSGAGEFAERGELIWPASLIGDSVTHRAPPFIALER
jgi:hypothetical protein